ncbi:sigma-70 family RNA polymerase sigma factor [Ruminococcus sp.]|uniref:sigma-70 family RNA polymerase sigma factor n=1 Tax=Ruminococcus sp. TaxID=41978 RepID=UPI0025FB2D91|nr:sigma-70 family RNA polymerase sigma factor [Ruminococcus sp.]
MQLIIQPCIKDDPILCELIQAGDQRAKEELCIKYQGLVRKYAYAYLNVYGNNLDVEDLEQFGYLGLLIAAEKLDFSYQNTFSTYAAFWIKQSISRGIADHGFTIRFPGRLLKAIGKCSGLDSYYEREGFDHAERMEAIADTMGIEVSNVEELLSIRKRYMNLASLNVPAGEDQSYELEELLEDTEQLPIEDQVVDSALLTELKKVLSTLTAREERVIRLRFGIGGEDGHTLDQVGEILELTRDRVRQIENDAMRKLRNPKRSKDLKIFYY